MASATASPSDSTIDKLCLKNVVKAIARRNAESLKVLKGRRHGRLLVCAEQAWLERVKGQADRLGITVAEYIRQVIVRQLLADEADDPARKKRT